MVTTTPAIEQPLDGSMCLYLPPSLSDFDNYMTSLALALPNLQQRVEMATLVRWRTAKDGTMTAGELFKLLCTIADPNDGNPNAAELRRIIAAQHKIWKRLQILADGYAPDLPRISGPSSIEPGEPPTLWEDEVKDWIEHFFTMLGKFETVEGFDASGIRGLLSPRVRETLTRQTARELLDTPFLLGYTLHQNANRFTDGPHPTRQLAIVLAAATRNAWHDVQGAPEHTVSQQQWTSLAFWSHVLRSFMYGAVCSGRNTLAVEVAENIDDRDLLRDALLTYTFPDCSAWKHWTRGNGADLNGRIVNATGPELWNRFRAQLEAA